MRSSVTTILLVSLTSIAAETPADCSWKLTDCKTRSRQDDFYKNCYKETSGEIDLCENLCRFNEYRCENYCHEFMELCMKPKQSTTTLAHTNAEVSHANESLTTSAINESVDHASPKHRPAAGSVIPVTYVIVIVVGMAIIAFPFCLGFNWNTFKKRVSLKACRRSPTERENGTELNAKRPNVEEDDGGSQTTSFIDVTVIDEQSAKKKKPVRQKSNRVSANLSSGNESMDITKRLSRQGVDNPAPSEIPPMANGEASSDDNATRNEDVALLRDENGKGR